MAATTKTLLLGEYPVTLTRQQMSEKRDKKIRSAMEQWAPIWLVSEDYQPQRDSLLFNLVYQHPIYGWVNQRFKYDGFNDVLYHLGERVVKEEDTLSIQEQEPFIPGEVATRVPNDPSRRLSPPWVQI
jgi:hypothetical protein